MAAFSVNDLMGSFSSMDTSSIGTYAFLGVILFLLGLLVLGGLALFFIALKKNWIIMKWPITVVLLKPSGDSVQPFLDKAAIITEGREEKWKLKVGKFSFTPPNRKYITPGNWLFAWSSTYREIIPLEMSVFGFMKNADPKEVQALMGQIKELDDKMQAIIDNPNQFEQLATLSPQAKSKAIDEIKAQIEAKKQTLYTAFETQQKTYQMALKPRVDTGIMNSMFAEGEKTIRQHKINDNLMIYAGLILTLIIVVVSLMLSAAQGMSYADAMKENSKAVQANAGAISMLVQQMNGSTGGYIIPVKK